MRVQLILEEFGKWLNSSVNATMDQRNKYFGIVYDEVETAASLPGSPLKVNAQISFHMSLYDWFCKQVSCGITSPGSIRLFSA